MSGGMSLGMGKSNSTTRSGSTSTSYGYSGSNSSDIARSIQEAISGGQSTTTQGVFAEDVFKRLFGGAMGAGERALTGAPELTAVAQQLFTGGSQFLQSLGNDAGSAHLASRITGENPLLDEQIAALKEDTGRMFREELNPAITSRAVAGGTLGGGRQGVAQGMAADAVTEQFTRGATALRAADIQQRDAAASEVMRGTLQSAATGLGALPTLLDIEERGMNSELGVFSSLANILGDRTVLSQSQATDFSRSTAQSIAEAFSRSFGEQRSNSDAWSYGRSKAWNFDMAASAGVM